MGVHSKHESRYSRPGPDNTLYTMYSLHREDRRVQLCTPGPVRTLYCCHLYLAQIPLQCTGSSYQHHSSPSHSKVLKSPYLPSMLLLLLLPLVLGHQVEVEQGLLSPRSPPLVSHKGKKILSYLGIPYGAPPVGQQRFQLPQAAPAWEGVLQADQSISCPQWDDWAGGLKGREDCLVTNVHVTEEALSKGGTPVMVWIHGGGFVFGDGSPEFYGPEWLLDFGVIMVSINYRLGALGFLSTGDQVGLEGMLETVSFNILITFISSLFLLRRSYLVTWVCGTSGLLSNGSRVISEPSEVTRRG